MARRGQVGTIAVSGKWYVVRFWMYPAGQDRIHASERICPVDSKAAGYLPKGERRRRANEIVEASGVNNPRHFHDTNIGTTFRQQAEWFMEHSAKRRRKPVTASTLIGWECRLQKWLNPHLGDLPVASITNATVKSLVAKLAEAKLSAQTIVHYTNLVKSVVGSALDDNGDQLFPRKWNNEFIDMPIIQNQHRPMPATDTLNGILENAKPRYRVLFTLLAGTGMRPGEALGIEIDKHVSAECRTINLFETKLLSLKNSAAKRKIDLHSSVAALLKSYIGDRTSGLVFPTDTGRKIGQSQILRDSLHPILSELGAEKMGLHSFRRVRITWLRKQRTIESLINFWTGHTDESMNGVYDKLFQDDAYRLEAAEKVGVGFIVPASMRPMRPRKAVQRKMKVAA